MEKSNSGTISDTLIYVIFFAIIAFGLGGVLFPELISGLTGSIDSVRDNSIAYFPIEIRSVIYLIVLGILIAIGKNIIKN